MPAAFKQSGLLTGPILLTFGAVLSGFANYSMFKAGILSSTNSYYNCVNHYFGKVHKQIKKIISLYYLF